MKEIRQIYSENPDMFRVDAYPSERRLAERVPINPYFQKLLLIKRKLILMSLITIRI